MVTLVVPVLPLPFKKVTLETSGKQQGQPGRPGARTPCHAVATESHWSLWKLSKAKVRRPRPKYGKSASRQESGRFSVFWGWQPWELDPASGLQDSKGLKTRRVWWVLRVSIQKKLSKDLQRPGDSPISLGKRNRRVRLVKIFYLNNIHEDHKPTLAYSRKDWDLGLW